MVVYFAQDPTKITALSKDMIPQKDTVAATSTGNCPGNKGSRCTETKDGLQGCSV